MSILSKSIFERFANIPLFVLKYFEGIPLFYYFSLLLVSVQALYEHFCGGQHLPVDLLWHSLLYHVLKAGKELRYGPSPSAHDSRLLPDAIPPSHRYLCYQCQLLDLQRHYLPHQTTVLRHLEL